MSMKELWRPTAESIEASAMYKFSGISNYQELHRWSIENKAEFWGKVWEFCDVRFSKPYSEVFVKTEKIPWVEWFPSARLNYAENLLREKSDRAAIISWQEDTARSELSFNELHKKVSGAQKILRDCGVGVGDVVAGYLPNIAETILAFLATSALGATWVSAAPEFAAKAVLSRFSQVSPKVIFTTDSYLYKGKKIDLTAKTKEIVDALPSLKKVISISEIQSSDKPVHFEQLPANHPLYILFSSGTTGKPKGIVHGAGGVLVKHLCEQKLHSNINANDRLFYQTTCGWMMWNWQVSALAQGATLCLYDGFPMLNEGRILWDLAEKEKFTIFGTNAAYLSALEKQGVVINGEGIENLRLILSTGSVLAPESYDYVYRDIKKDIQLSSFSGGTDIVGLFFDSNPMLPVTRDQLQCVSLGMDVRSHPPDEEKGSLVCGIPFPSMPVRFVDDADGSKYFSAYFAQNKNLWTHGDLIKLHLNGGVTMYGREDALLNKNGVRIGTAEIYNPLQEIAEINSAIAVTHQKDNNDRIVLFVKLNDGYQLTDELKEKISKKIVQDNSPWHKPDFIIAAPDLPITRSGKLAELIVRDIINGKPIRSAEGLANEECLSFFTKLSF